MQFVAGTLLLLIVALLTSGSAAAGGVRAAEPPSALQPSANGERIGCRPGKQVNLGAGTEAAPIVGGELLDGLAYTVSRGLQPAQLAVTDLDAGEVVESYEVPTGGGAWATTIANGDLYLGTYNPSGYLPGETPDLYRYQPGADRVELVASFTDDTYVYDADSTPDGHVVVGTYPTASVYDYDPATGEVRPYGSVSEEAYVRAVSATDETIYAGIGSSAELLAIDRSSGDVTDITPEEITGEAFVYSLAVTDDLIVAGTNPGGYLVLLDRDDPSVYEVVESGKGTVDAIAVVGDTIYATTRRDGELIAYDRFSEELTVVAVPSPGDETRNLVVDGQRLVGFAGSGAVWTYALDDGGVELVDLVAAGHPVSPEPPQSIIVSKGAVHVAGHWNITRHYTDASTDQFRIPGEAKAMAAVGDQVYAALYPGARLWAYDARASDPMPRHVADVGEDQDRPRSMAYSRAAGLLAIGTRPVAGQLGGALALIDPVSGRADTYRDVIADQSINAVAWSDDGKVVYLGSETFGGGGTPPVGDVARLAAWDVDDKRKLWEVIPVSDASTIVDVEFVDGYLVGVASVASDAAGFRLDPVGTGFRVDPTTGEIVTTGALPSGDMAAASVSLYATDFDTVVHVDPVTLETTEIASGLNGDSYSNRVLATGRPCALYTLTERDLLRISVQPHASSRPLDRRRS